MDVRNHKLCVTKTTIITTKLDIYLKIQMCSTHAWKSLICLPPSVGAQISSPRVACETAKGTTPSITIVRIIEEIDRKLILGFDATSSGLRLHLPFRTMIVDSFTPLRCRLQWVIWSARCVYIEKYEQNWNRACGLGLPPHAFFHYF